ncbi:MAG: hypothetical protein MHM6MM_004812 [Cercozoa sp. M6MM]
MKLLLALTAIVAAASAVIARPIDELEYGLAQAESLELSVSDLQASDEQNAVLDMIALQASLDIDAEIENDDDTDEAIMGAINDAILQSFDVQASGLRDSLDAEILPVEGVQLDIASQIASEALEEIKLETEIEFADEMAKMDDDIVLPQGFLKKAFKRVKKFVVKKVIGKAIKYVFGAKGYIAYRVGRIAYRVSRR